MSAEEIPLSTPTIASTSEERLHDLEAIQKATFNILEDYAHDGDRFRDMQRATFNVLEDAAAEREQLRFTQSASLNLLEDFALEKKKLEETQSASFNILDDFALEKERLEETQRASFNILEDFLLERQKMEDLQQAAFNILQDLNDEKGKLEGEVGTRKRAETELENANKELEAFSYSVSHDLRAPLRGIDGFSQALLEDYGDKLDDTGKMYLSHVRTSSQQMAQLIDDLLSLSQMSRGEFRRSLVSVSDLAASLIAGIRRGDPERLLEVTIESGLTANADSRLLKVALENLFGNAWKFSRKTLKPRIEFGQRMTPRGLTFYVSDNGAGFDMAFSSKLFGAFQRLHSAEEFPGTGVGLATVRRVINRHGGEIWAESEPGKGSTFFFTLE